MRRGRAQLTGVAPVVAASLLIHLAVLYAATRTASREVVRVREPSGVVAYLDLHGEEAWSTAGSRKGRAHPAWVTPPERRAVPADAKGASPEAGTGRQAPAAPLPHAAAAPVPAQDGSGSRQTAARAGGESGAQGTAAPPAGSAAAPPGTGAGSAAAAVSASSSPSSFASSQRLRGAYQAQLRSLIEARKEYPLAARKSGREGSCRRRFLLGRDGSLLRVETLSSCGHPFLDAAATRAISSVAAFPPLPEEFSAEEPFDITITFALSRR